MNFIAGLISAVNLLLSTVNESSCIQQACRFRD